MSEMKEMVYTSKRLPFPEILVQDSYNGYNYFVHSMGTHPCAYVEIPKDNKFFGKSKDIISKAINCHGGITFVNSNLYGVDHYGYFIGWNYGHYGDFLGYVVGSMFELVGSMFEKDDEDVKYSTPEMVRDCKAVIDQLVLANC